MNTAGEIAEVLTAGAVGQFKGITDESLAADLLQPPGKVMTGIFVPSRANHTALRLADHYDIAL